MCTKTRLTKTKGTSTELMPSIMGAFDAIIENTRTNKDNTNELRAVQQQQQRKTHQVGGGNFAHLSPYVQKILANVPDKELSKTFSSEETLAGSGGKRCSKLYTTYRSMRSPEKSASSSLLLNRSNESLDIISPNVQKMISNFPDTELVLTGAGRNASFLHQSKSAVFNGTAATTTTTTTTTAAAASASNDGDGHNCAGVKTFLYHSDGSKDDCSTDCCDKLLMHHQCDTCDSGKNCEYQYSPRPLGSYLHTSPHGIASRTPAGRKNMGKFLQVPSESSVGTTSSTASSEVSRPVSLTSLGSCSSSGSSGGPHQPGSAYLASAESLDSDPEPTGSQGSADSGIAEQPTMSPEARVLQEVLDTETVYVADLNEVIQGYLEPWKSDPDCPLVPHLQDLFSNLQEIYTFNKQFLEGLREADCDPTKTANVFIQNDEGFSVYNEYCTNYPRTMDVLGELTRDEKMVPLIREKQIALGHALPLGSYLLKPVQRILKYHLLLQRLSKQCESDHKPTVDLALATMTAVASGINNMKRKHEHAVRVQEIQSQLYGWNGPDLTALGELIAEGTFRVNKARGRRHVFLFDKVLLMAKNKQDGALAYKSHIMCSNLMLVEQVRGEPLSFHVLPFDNPRLQCTLRARSPQHKREWTLQIKRVILENYSAVIPNHARQLVMQLGQDVQENEDSTDKWSPLKQHSTPHYLERRSRVRKSRDLSGSRRASSQDRSFPSLGSWRRKSEPSFIPQYNVKTMPKKISKMKKAKEKSGAKFYTDLSDSETNDVIGESNESLEIEQSSIDSSSSPDKCDGGGGIEETTVVENNLEKIVSDLLMQNEEFHKVMSRQKRCVRGSEPEPAIWFEEERPTLPSKADSLPRSFQLNDQIEGSTTTNQHQNHVLDNTLNENPNVDEEEQHENDLSSQLDDQDHDYPVHKIYRKTAIRFSLLQRFRAIVSEEQRRNKYPLHKQGSKSMGEKIAHPDYVDPQKLFTNPSCNSSRTNLTLELPDCDIMEPERLDMTISGKDVLKEIDKRLNDSSTKPVPDTGQQNSSQNEHFNNNNNNNDNNNTLGKIESSQNSDSYYESMLEKDLVEEYTKDENGKLIAKQDSFKSAENPYTDKFCNNGPSSRCERKIQRPTKAPPPIPTKPTRLINNCNSFVISNSCSTTITKAEKMNSSEVTTIIRSNSKIIKNTTTETNRNAECNNKSWVKAMVGRFE